MEIQAILTGAAALVIAGLVEAMRRTLRRIEDTAIATAAKLASDNSRLGELERRITATENRCQLMHASRRTGR
jgi:hypothetical protein